SDSGRTGRAGGLPVVAPPGAVAGRADYRGAGPGSSMVDAARPSRRGADVCFPRAAAGLGRRAARHLAVGPATDRGVRPADSRPQLERSDATALGCRALAGAGAAIR